MECLYSSLIIIIPPCYFRHVVVNYLPHGNRENLKRTYENGIHIDVFMLMATRRSAIVIGLTVRFRSACPCSLIIVIRPTSLPILRRPCAP